MKIALAPKPLVDYANALFHGGPVAKAYRNAAAFLNQVAGELAVYGDHFLGDNDRAQYLMVEENLEDLRSFLEESQTLDVSSSDLMSFVDCGRVMIQILEAFEQERQQPQYVGLAPFDQLLTAGVAHLHGRGTRQAVEKRLPFAQQAMKKLRSRLEGCQSLFPEAFLKELRQAAHEVERGLGDIDLWLSSDRYTKLGAGITRLHNFADKLACLAPTPAPSRGQSGQPLGMAELEMLAQDPHSEDFELAVRRFAALGFPSLLGFWEEVRQRLLLSAAFAASVRAEIDEAFAELEEAISAESIDASRVSQAAEDVVHGFWFIRERRLSLAPAAGTSLEPAVQVLAAACQGGVADVELADVVTLLRGWAHHPQFAHCLLALEQYMACPGTTALLGCLEEMLVLARRLPARLVSQNRPSTLEDGQVYPDQSGSRLSLSA